jgi:hypothetical protein
MRAGILDRVPRHAWPNDGRTGRSRLVLAAVVTAALLALMQAPARAAIDPYPAAGSGYDASYPSAQCNTNTYPSGFAIIGLGGGRPFTTNACLTHEWNDASNGGPTPTPATPSLYFNTGYAGAYAKQITAGCQNAVGHAPIPPSVTGHQRSTEEQAWEIGCSEAAYAAVHEPGTPAMWWADVETGNSWSTNTTYNDLAIDGIAYEMSGLGTPTGFYSTPAMWDKIAGAGFASTPAADAVWQPASSCQTASGFSNSPVWLIQNGTVTAGGASFSQDVACP